MVCYTDRNINFRTEEEERKKMTMNSSNLKLEAKFSMKRN